MQTEASLWRLDSAQTTLLIVHDAQVPRLLWCGHRLDSSFDIDTLLAHDNTALAFADLDTIAPLTLFPENGSGYQGSAALNGHRQARNFAHQFALQSVEQTENSISMQLSDSTAELTAGIAIELDAESGVASIQTSLSNTGSEPYTVDWLASATIPLPAQHTSCMTQHGHWGLENQLHRRAIDFGRIDISNLHGRTSHQHAPSVICGSEGFNQDQGDVLAAHLGWSGNFSMRIERLSDGNSYLQAGVLLLPGEQQLQPGNTLTTPALVFTRASGINQSTQRFHHFIRRRVLPAWTRQPRPVHANSWEALYFDHDVDSLCELIDAAASVGAERFVLDDGWFRHRRNDQAGLGDWYVDDAIYPEGLQPLVDRIRRHGMQFGLWFEPEMVNPDSDLYRAHPEWALQLDGYDTPLARNQLALDIARDDVQSYLFERITSLVHDYGIDYIKWDMNRDLVLPGNGQTGRAAAQPPALYKLLDAIIQACPRLEIETCASGGARADLGVLRYTGRVWTSDNIDPIERATIQRGFMQFLPPEIMGAHVGHQAAHLTGRVSSLHTRAIVALQGQFGFELDARRLDPHDILTLQHYTQLYKHHRHWLSNACYWQLPATSTSLIASGQVSEDTSCALYTVVATQSLQATRPGPLLLKGLTAEATYRLTLESSNVNELVPFNKAIPDWCEESVITTGELLMTLGVPLPVMPPQTALLIGCHLETQ